MSRVVPSRRRAVPGPSRTHRPRKRFGQHFLAPGWARKVVAAIDPQPGDVFLEIGPGTGALTLPLAETGAPILGVEIDRDLAADLASKVPPNVTILTADVLTADLIPFLCGLGPQATPSTANAASAGRRFRIVGNLPYNIASPILFRLIELHRRDSFFHDAVVMVQREVADRLTARPRTRDYGVLTVMMSVHATCSRLLELPPGAFRPPPKVRSTVVRLAFGTGTARIRDEALFEVMVKAMFGQRRKTLGNALKTFDRTAPAVLALAGIDPGRRPETLQLPELARLAELFAASRQPPVL